MSVKLPPLLADQLKDRLAAVRKQGRERYDGGERRPTVRPTVLPPRPVTPTPAASVQPTPDGRMPVATPVARPPVTAIGAQSSPSASTVATLGTCNTDGPVLWTFHTDLAGNRQVRVNVRHRTGAVLAELTRNAASAGDVAALLAAISDAAADLGLADAALQAATMARLRIANERPT